MFAKIVSLLVVAFFVTNSADAQLFSPYGYAAYAPAYSAYSPYYYGAAYSALYSGYPAYYGWGSNEGESPSATSAASQWPVTNNQ